MPMCHRKYILARSIDEEMSKRLKRQTDDFSWLGKSVYERRFIKKSGLGFRAIKDHMRGDHD